MLDKHSVGGGVQSKYTISHHAHFARKNAQILTFAPAPPSANVLATFCKAIGKTNGKTKFFELFAKQIAKQKCFE